MEPALQRITDVIGKSKGVTNNNSPLMTALNSAKDDTSKKSKDKTTSSSGSMFADLLSSFGEELETGKVSKRKRSEAAKAESENTPTDSTTSKKQQTEGN